MELYYVMTILDRDQRDKQEKIYKSLGLNVALTMMGRGTATPHHLDMHGLSPTEKAIVATVADRQKTNELFRQTMLKLNIDIPGYGIMAAIPIKSIGGINTVAYLTGQEPQGSEKPDLKFDHELIYVVLNEGHVDEVMAAARPAGAMGGTVIKAKGSGVHPPVKFKKISITKEREVILIVAKSSNKAEIMRAILEKAGMQTPAGAFCFSMPVTKVAGLRKLDDEEE